MSETIRCRVDGAVVRESRREDLKKLLRQLFERRHHEYVGGQERMWLRVELVQSLRRQSTVYRASLSEKTSGPLPFALGYLQVRDGQLEAVADEVPADVPPETLVRILSEFVEPGSAFVFGSGDDAERWVVRGIDDVNRTRE
jgi:hypothetical protein